MFRSEFNVRKKLNMSQTPRANFDLYGKEPIQRGSAHVASQETEKWSPNPRSFLDSENMTTSEGGVGVTASRFGAEFRFEF